MNFVVGPASVPGPTTVTQLGTGELITLPSGVEGKAGVSQPPPPTVTWESG